MQPIERLSQRFPFLRSELIEVIFQNGIIQNIPKDAVILREGQYISSIPIIFNGLVKVFGRHQERELLLYYIRPFESCVMSFASALRGQASQVQAIAEEDSEVLLLPAEKVQHWIREFPELNMLFFQQYNLRYTELIETIQQVLFEKMDKRLYDFLKERSTLMGHKPLKMSHRQIAQELGTAREVVSRVLKKLESEEKISQSSEGIQVLHL